MIIGCMIWYEESSIWLSAAVASAARFCDHIVAVDGAYVLFPAARARSGPEQHEAILATCHALGIGSTIHTPREVWYGNEVEKRTAAFRLAEQVAEPWTDWYYVLDADEFVSDVPSDIRARLDETELDVAECTVWEGHNADHPGERYVEGASLSRNAIRKFFRAIPGLRVEGAHYLYLAEREERTMYLWGHPDLTPAAEPALNLTDLRVEHRNRFRNRYRNRLANDYYATRDAIGAERIADVYVHGLDGEPVLFEPGHA